MTIIRLTNGADVAVKASVTEVLALLGKGGDDFVEFPGEDASMHLRPSMVIAVLGDGRKGTAGFRIGVSGAAS